MQQQSYWMWNYGDYEIFHANMVHTRRQEYGADYPCFWRLYDVDRNVKFFADITVEKEGSLTLFLKGVGYLLVDGKRYPAMTEVPIAVGAHRLQIAVTNLHGLPAAYIGSDVCSSGAGWYTLDADHRRVPVGYELCYDDPQKDPEVFPFSYERRLPVHKECINGGLLFDFGKEIFGYLSVCGAAEDEKLHISYGESREEALDTAWSILFEEVSGAKSYRLRQRAFRYIWISGSETVDVSADYEYLPLPYKGSFTCDSDDINAIWQMCAYTLHLTTREVQLEAIKRDRWLWGGDAYQAYKFNNYLFFDKEVVRRSTIALRGKEPFVEHINTITDYSFYWVIGLQEYYRHYADIDFIRFIYPRAVSLMAFAARRVNRDGFIVGKEGDWIFIDWADMDKSGALCAEQILYIAANRSMAYLAALLGEDGTAYAKTAEEMTKKTNEYFWCSEKGAYIDTYESGKRHVTRHANIFAILYQIATPAQQEAIVSHVLLNDQIAPITTPYFAGYELDAFGMLGYFDHIEDRMRSYWKGMLDLGATTVWEEYDPTLSGAEHYKMYGDKYAKSLCHAWGAAPIYLLGKYFLGVTPEADGFTSFTVKPYRGHMAYIHGVVPIKDGQVEVYLSDERLTVTATRAGGTLVWQGKEYPLPAGEAFTLPV